MRARAGGLRCAGFSPAAGLLLLAALLLIASLIWLLNPTAGPAPADSEVASPEEFHEPLLPERLGSLPPEVLERAEPSAIPAEAAVFEPYSLLENVDRIRDLHGIVLRPDGQPCANAVVLVQRPWQQCFQWEDPLKSVEKHEVARLRTNQSGEWKLTVNPGSWYEVEAWFDKWVAPPVHQCQAGERVDFRLSESGIIHGVVTAARDGSRLPSMDVIAVHWLSGGGWDRRHDLKTEFDGSYRLEGLEPGRWSVAASSSRHDYESELLDLEPGATIQQDLQLKLNQGLVCHGRVVDAATGLPLPGAEVSRRSDLLNRIGCDPSGAFVLTGIEWPTRLEAGISVYARAAGYGTGGNVLLRDALDSFEIQLSRGSVVTGRVLLPNRLPAAGAYVAIMAKESLDQYTGHYCQSALVHQDGSFIIWDVRPDLRNILIIRRQGSGTLYRELPIWRADLEKFDTGTLQMSASSTLAGVVVDEKGNALSGCEVWCGGEGRDLRLLNPESESRYWSYEGRLEGRTDDLGRFRFADIEPGKYSIGARAPGYINSLLEQEDYLEVKEGESGENLRIILKPGISVRGKVVDQEGRPVEGATLTLEGELRNPEFDFERSNRKGEFSFYGVPPGTYRLVFDPQSELQEIKNGTVYARYALPDVVVILGMKSLTVKLERTDAITGAVTDADGRPALAIVGALNAAEELIVEAPTGADGRFELRMLEGLTVNLVARFADPQANSHLPEESRPRARFDAIPVGAREVQLRIPGRP